MLVNGWFVTRDGAGEPLIYKILAGSPYQVETDEAEGAGALVLALEPGYYTDDLDQVPDEEALSPDTGQIAEKGQ